ncbi:hypothetical protein ABZW03_10555 [Kitasatospora sp. NPDC004799]|uniref:hypothetical protein n=1 Tax=Kitasatospora sp. NPDC004799 TaxID=3154460 RepID=UPI0033B29AFB
MTTPAAATPQQHTFWPAGRGHFHASVKLAKESLPGSADHLAGLAAECVVKAYLIDFLGFRFNPKGPPMDPTGARTKLGHVNELWPELTQIVSGRVGPDLMSLIYENPFDGWSVHDRYADGNGIQAAELAQHIDAARRLCALYELASKGHI